MTGFCLNGILKNTTSHRSVGGFRAVRPGAWRPLSERNPEVNVESI
jgi:hypothetical protein